MRIVKTLAHRHILSIAVIALVMTFCLLSAPRSSVAHEIRPAVADITINPDNVLIELKLTVEPILAGASLAGLSDTNQSPASDQIDAYRLRPVDEIERIFEESWPQIKDGIIVRTDDEIYPIELISIRTAAESDTRLPRDSTLHVRVGLPSGSSPVRFGWVAAYGPIIVRQIADVDAPYSAYLTDGALSDPMPRTGAATISKTDLFIDYVAIGFEHILPKGLDHILFVLGLFFFALKLSALVWQISAFTLAHTVTLALATLGYVSVPGSIVEPLIAASIIYVAIENIVHRSITVWRTLIVFAFGLLHGLGFASVLGDVGLEPTRFVTSLIGFNVGVELGQLAVIAVAFVIFGLPFGQRTWYRARVAVPGSILIAMVGAFWFFERVIG